ncbi:hypothetical protein THAOC_01056 [Thalassiosira oceanica]|uniref:Major facilitator superfamily (MFS) profile domain-containing protein n=1 Tax=Thalassiosira oceanica TaxID=159749 RepID=K0TR40_THAOC|nr:hypothetical protein THAOC_01056 [Thalassiosira oceanica]|eukprot:EJK77132.1 hypothetical protein THAOC_01056 [Thalassiosira oceanica]
MSTEVASGAVSDVSVSCDGWPRAETLSIRRVGRDDRRRPFDADSVLGHRPPAAIALDADGACDVCNGGVKHHSRCMALTLLILSFQPAEIKKYSTYHVNVDPDQDDKATEIKLLSFKRPHMRAFHCSWMGFFTVRLFHMVRHRASPAGDQKYPWSDQAAGLDVEYLLSCRNDRSCKQLVMVHRLPNFRLTSPFLFTTQIIYRRFINGPMCDKYGARLLMGVLLMAASIPCACTGLVNSSVQLSVLRFFIGLGGSTFVCCQFWTSRMFTKEVAGTANALVGGWGNLGGGV